MAYDVLGPVTQQLKGWRGLSSQKSLYSWTGTGTPLDIYGNIN